MKEIGKIIVYHYDGNGKLLYNNNAALLDIGEEKIFKSYFQNIDSPDDFLIDLSSDVTILDSASTFTPVAGSGYDTEIIERNSIDFNVVYVTDGTNSYWEAKTKTVSFTAIGAWTEAVKVILRGRSGGSNYMIAYGDLLVPRTLENGDRLDVNIALYPTIV